MGEGKIGEGDPDRHPEVAELSVGAIDR